MSATVADVTGINEFKDPVKFIRGAGSAITNGVKPVSQWVFDPVKNAMHDVAGLAKDVPKVYNWGSQQMSSALNTVKPIVSSAWNTTKPMVQRYGAVALPVAGAMIGGPLGLGVGTALSANSPFFKEGWNANVKDVGGALGVKEIRDNPNQVGTAIALGSGAYGLANAGIAGGSPTSFSWGNPLTSGARFLTASGAPQVGSVPVASGGVNPFYANAAQGAGLIQTGGGGAAAASQAAASPLTLGQVVGPQTLNTAYLSGVKSAGMPLADKVGLGALGLEAAGLLGGLFGSKAPEPSTYVVPQGGTIEGVDLSSQEAYMDAMNKYADQMAQIAAGQYQSWQQNGLPVQTKMANEALVGIDPNWWADRAQSETQAAYDAAVAQVRRNADRLGISPDSPAYANAIAQMLGPSMAAAKAGAANTARQGVEEANWSRLSSANQQLSGLPSQSAAIYGNAGNILGNAAQVANQSANIAMQQQQYNANLQNHAALANWQAQNEYAQLMAQQQNDFWGNLLGLGGMLGTGYLLST